MRKHTNKNKSSTKGKGSPHKKAKPYNMCRPKDRCTSKHQHSPSPWAASVATHTLPYHAFISIYLILLATGTALRLVFYKLYIPSLSAPFTDTLIAFGTGFVADSLAICTCVALASVIVYTPLAAYKLAIQIKFIEKVYRFFTTILYSQNQKTNKPPRQNQIPNKNNVQKTTTDNTAYNKLKSPFYTTTAMALWMAATAYLFTWVFDLFYYKNFAQRLSLHILPHISPFAENFKAALKIYPLAVPIALLFLALLSGAITCLSLKIRWQFLYTTRSVILSRTSHAINLMFIHLPQYIFCKIKNILNKKSNTKISPAKSSSAPPSRLQNQFSNTGALHPAIVTLAFYIAFSFVYVLSPFYWSLSVMQRRVASYTHCSQEENSRTGSEEDNLLASMALEAKNKFIGASLDLRPKENQNHSQLKTTGGLNKEPVQFKTQTYQQKANQINTRNSKNGIFSDKPKSQDKVAAHGEQEGVMNQLDCPPDLRRAAKALRVLAQNGVANFLDPQQWRERSAHNAVVLNWGEVDYSLKKEVFQNLILAKGEEFANYRHPTLRYMAPATSSPHEDEEQGPNVLKGNTKVSKIKTRALSSASTIVSPREEKGQGPNVLKGNTKVSKTMTRALNSVSTIVSPREEKGQRPRPPNIVVILSEGLSGPLVGHLNTSHLTHQTKQMRHPSEGNPYSPAAQSKKSRSKAAQVMKKYHHALRTQGLEASWTPQLDQLAAQGLWWDNFYYSVVSSNISTASYLMGYPVWDYQVYQDAKKHPIQPVFHFLNQNFTSSSAMHQGTSQQKDNQPLPPSRRRASGPTTSRANNPRRTNNQYDTLFLKSGAKQWASTDFFMTLIGTDLTLGSEDHINPQWQWQWAVSDQDLFDCTLALMAFDYAGQLRRQHPPVRVFDESDKTYQEYRKKRQLAGLLDAGFLDRNALAATKAEALKSAFLKSTETNHLKTGAKQAEPPRPVARSSKREAAQLRQVTRSSKRDGPQLPQAATRAQIQENLKKIRSNKKMGLCDVARQKLLEAMDLQFKDNKINPKSITRTQHIQNAQHTQQPESIYKNIKRPINSAPLYITLLTTTIHDPMGEGVPTGQFENIKNPLERSVRYYDAQVGRFIQKARHILGPNTIYVITGDHAHARNENSLEYSRLPLIILDDRRPWLKGRRAKVGAHVDLATTLVYLARPPQRKRTHNLKLAQSQTRNTKPSTRDNGSRARPQVATALLHFVGRNLLDDSDPGFALMLGTWPMMRYRKGPYVLHYNRATGQGESLWRISYGQQTKLIDDPLRLEAMTYELKSYMYFSKRVLLNEEYLATPE